MPSRDRNAARRLNELELELRRLKADQQRGLAGRPGIWLPPRDLYPAMTVAIAGEGSGEDGYPTPPCDKFHIVFIDDYYDRADIGRERRHGEARQHTADAVVARNTSGCFPPVGTYCWVGRYRGQRATDDEERGHFCIVQLDLPMSVTIKTPSGGIAGRNDSDVAGKAVCQFGYIDDSDTFQLLTDYDGAPWTETVYNVSYTAVAGDRWGNANREAFSGRLIVDVESCGDPT